MYTISREECQLFFRNPFPGTPVSCPLTFHQVYAGLIEFRALPGPEARALRAKIMRQHSSSGLGGQAVLCPRTGLFRCRGARPKARWARLILRKPNRLSVWISFPADAFSAQRPSFRATSLFFRGKERNQEEGASPPVFLDIPNLSIIPFAYSSLAGSVSGPWRSGLMIQTDIFSPYFRRTSGGRKPGQKKFRV